MTDYNLEIDAYLKRMGGPQAWQAWLSRVQSAQGLPENFNLLALKAVAERDPAAWEQFKQWNKNYLWKRRGSFSDEEWKTISQRMGLPESRSAIKRDLSVVRDFMLDTERGDIQEVAKEAGEAVSQKAQALLQYAAKTAKDPRELAEWSNLPYKLGEELVNFALDTPLAKSKTMQPYVERMQKLVPSMQILYDQRKKTGALTMALAVDSLIEDIGGIVDLMIPDSVEDIFFESPLLTIKAPSGDRIPIVPFMARYQSVKEDLDWVSRFTDSRINALKEQGVSDDAINILKMGAEFIEVGAGFAIAPSGASLKAARIGKQLSTVRKIASAEPTAENLAEVARLSKKLAKTVASKGGVLDEIGKGAFVGVVTTEGPIEERAKEALWWGGIGAGFGGLTRAYRELFKSSKSVEYLFHGLVAQNFTPQEMVQTLTTDFVEPETRAAMKAILNRSSLLFKGRPKLTPIFPTKAHLEAQTEQARILREIELLQDPEAVRRGRIKLEEYNAKEAAEAAGQVYTPLTEEQIAFRLAQEQDRIEPLWQQLHELHSRNPELFPEVPTPRELNENVVVGYAGKQYQLSTDIHRIEVGSRVDHKKFGSGRVLQVTGTGREQNVVVNFDRVGKKTIKPMEAWKIETGAEATFPMVSQYDMIKYLVEERKMSPHQARIALITMRMREGDPAARLEAIKMIGDDFFNAPSELGRPHAEGGYSSEMLEAFNSYYAQPMGQHPYFQGGDDAAIMRQVDEKGYAVFTALPWNLFDEAGAEIPGSGPRSRILAALGFGHSTYEATKAHRSYVTGSVKSRGKPGIADIRLRTRRFTAGEGSLVDRYVTFLDDNRPAGAPAGAFGTNLKIVREKSLKGRPYSRDQPRFDVIDQEMSISQEAEIARMLEAGEITAEEAEDMVGTITSMHPGEAGPLRDYGVTVYQFDRNLPHGDEIIIVTKSPGFTGDRGFVDGAVRQTMEKGLTPQQIEKEYLKAVEFLNNPENWPLFLPPPSPTLYADETAQALHNYLSTMPPLAELFPFRPAAHNLGVVTRAGEVYGLPEEVLSIETRGGGWYQVGGKKIRGKEEAERVARSLQEPGNPNDILADASVMLDYPTTALSLVQKQEDGSWKIIAGLGEETSHQLLKEEVEHELGVLGLTNRDSRYAEMLRENLRSGEEAQGRVAHLNEYSPSNIEKFKQQQFTQPEKMYQAPPESLHPETHIYKREFAEEEMHKYSKHAMERGMTFGVAQVDLSNLHLVDVLLGKEEGKRAWLAAVEQVKKTAGKHGLRLGHWNDDKIMLWGPFKEDVTALQTDLQSSFRTLRARSPEVMDILFNGEAPAIIIPDVGIAYGKGVPVKSLVSWSDARTFQHRQFNKGAKWAQGFLEIGETNPVRMLEDGTVIFEGSWGEFAVPPKSSEFWEQVANVKITKQGGKVVVRDGKLTVVRDGEVMYTADDWRGLAILETQFEPLAEQDISAEAFAAFGGGFPDDIGGITGQEEGVPFVHMMPHMRSWGEWARYMYMKTRTVAQLVQSKYGFPAMKYYDDLALGFNKMRVPLNRGMKDLEKALKHSNNKKAREGVGQIMFLPAREQLSTLKTLYGPNELRLYNNLRRLYHNLYRDMGIPEEVGYDNILNMVSRRIEGTLEEEFVRAPWMDQLTPIFTSYRLSAQNPDAANTFHKLLRGHLRRRHIDPVLRRMRTDLRETPLSELPPDARKVMARMQDVFRGSADADFLSTSAAIARLFRGGEGAYEFAQQLPAVLLSMQYLSSMAFRVGLPFRNLFQPLVTTAPLIGVRDVLNGWRRAFQVLRNQEKAFNNFFTGKISWDELKELGVVTEYIPVPAGEMFTDAASASTFVGKIHKANRAGLKMQQLSDHLNRMTSFFGAVDRGSRYLNRALRERKDFEWFASHADLNMFHRLDRDKWRGMWDKAMRGEGSWRELLVDFGKRVADDSQYVYASFAQPRAFHHVITKMGMQYGVWPVNYFDLLKERGIFNSASKARFWRRLLSVHGSIAGAGALAGAPLVDWVFFEPFQYSGGPFLQYTTQMLGALQKPEGQKLPELDRVTKRMMVQMLPCGGLLRYDLEKANRYLAKGDGVGALMAVFRLSDWPGAYDVPR